LTVSEAQALKANLVIPDSLPFKSDQCTPNGSLEKFVPNPFMKDLGTTRFIVGNCVTVTGRSHGPIILTLMEMLTLTLNLIKGVIHF
jgi:hypothetical protein